MALSPLGTITVTSAGTPVAVSTNTTLRAQSIMFQALKIAGGHTNSGNVYILAGPNAASAVRVGTLAVPTANAIPSLSITIPNANASLCLFNFFLDADVSGDGADVTFLGP